MHEQKWKVKSQLPQEYNHKLQNQRHGYRAFISNHGHRPENKNITICKKTLYLNNSKGPQRSRSQHWDVAKTLKHITIVQHMHREAQAHVPRIGLPLQICSSSSIGHPPESCALERGRKAFPMKMMLGYRLGGRCLHHPVLIDANFRGFLITKCPCLKLSSYVSVFSVNQSNVQEKNKILF